jgi:DNA-binding transcriptional ArsR family regulator
MQRLDQSFAALADSTRRGILAFLTKGEATVSQVVDQFELTQPTISSHLKILEGAGLITRGRRAQTRPCMLNAKGMQAIDAWLENFRAAQEGNYARLDALLDELKGKAPKTEE